jgi:putative transposase
MLEHTSLSERRACRLAGLSRDAHRHPPEPTASTQALSARIIELAQVRRRFGYRRLHDLLDQEFPGVNYLPHQALRMRTPAEAYASAA